MDVLLSGIGYFWTEMVDVGPAGAASSSGSSQDNSNAGEEDKKDERMFECNICLDTAKDAVISMCGHLFW